MNLFYLSVDPEEAARFHCDKHVVKMIVEYAQLLSTCHRILDGTPTSIEYTDDRLHASSGEVRQRAHTKQMWLMPGETTEVGAHPEREGHKRVLFQGSPLYAASHVKHPDAIWLRQCTGNYVFLYELFYFLSKEYEHRYFRVHSTFERLRQVLRVQPRNLPNGLMTEPPLCMPDEYKVENNAVLSYQNLYVESKSRFARWTNRQPPQWFIERTQNYDKTHFERTRHMAF